MKSNKSDTETIRHGLGNEPGDVRERRYEVKAARYTRRGDSETLTGKSYALKETRSAIGETGPEPLGLQET